MVVKILVFGDTHISNYNQLPKEIIAAIKNSNWVIHTGDYTHINLLNELKKKKGNQFKGVYGNSDPKPIRDILPYKQIIDIHEKKIGIIHPAKGGLLKNPIQRVLGEFKNDKLDIIIFGHTHEAMHEVSEGILFINPGKGYIEKNSYGPKASFAQITIDTEINVKIHTLD